MYNEIEEIRVFRQLQKEAGDVLQRRILMGKFVIKTTATGTKFDLKATNGQVIASSQVYKSAAT